MAKYTLYARTGTNQTDNGDYPGTDEDLRFHFFDAGDNWIFGRIAYGQGDAFERGTQTYCEFTDNRDLQSSHFLRIKISPLNTHNPNWYCLWVALALGGPDDDHPWIKYWDVNDWIRPGEDWKLFQPRQRRDDPDSSAGSIVSTRCGVAGVQDEASYRTGIAGERTR